MTPSGATPFSWKCPFCQQNATITREDFNREAFILRVNNSYNEIGTATEFTVCPNPDCKKVSLCVGLYSTRIRAGQRILAASAIHEWRLIPASLAKVFPDYVPQAVRDDYAEACSIRELSPKAAATLARRALQGMIRDFWKVSKSRLKDAIDVIEDKVDPLTWQAIEGVRTVGNIGAHMEKDIDLIIDVEPQEAGLLIGLVETLVDDWYVTRATRQVRLQDIVEMAKSKAEERRGVQDIEAGTSETGTQ